MRKKNGAKPWCYWVERFTDIQCGFTMFEHNWGLNNDALSPELYEEAKQIKHYDTLTSMTCCQFAEQGAWPIIPPVIAPILYFRICRLIHTLMLFYSTQGAKTTSAIIRPPDLAKVSEAEVLEFFLVDWWYRTAPKWFQDFRSNAIGRLLKEHNPEHVVFLGLNKNTCENIYEGSEQLGLEFLVKTK